MVIDFGRQPQLNSEYKKIDEVGRFSIHRKWVGNSLARFFFAIDGSEMKLCAVLPKDDDTYKFSNYHNRLTDL